LAFLNACTTPSRSTESPREASTLTPAISANSPASESPPGKADIALERTYRSALPICFDAALRVCRDRDYPVRKQERAGDQTATIWASGRSFEFTLAFVRMPSGQTRLILRVQGHAAQENRDEGSRLFDKLCEALLEPRE
jgi:hypothetical protein